MPRPAPSLFAEPAAPTPNWVTAHCDGGARGNPGPAGFGAQICDAHGHVLAELSEYLGHRTNNYAEYSGLLACLQWALENHHSALKVVSDSELMVKQIQGLYKVKSPDLLPLWQEAKRRIAKLENFNIAHALRHKNKEADRLANEAMDRGTHRPRTAGDPPKPFPTAQTPSPRPTTNRSSRAEPTPSADPAQSGMQRPSVPAAKPQMLRGFTRNGVIHVLGGATLPDGIFVKILPEDELHQ